MSDGIATLSEVPCSTVTFRSCPASTQQRLLALGYSPPLETDKYEFKTLTPLIGGETVCYVSHIFFTYYEIEDQELTP
jgi:hypothetical protein